jgi:hypothetical protein
MKIRNSNIIIFLLSFVIASVVFIKCDHSAKSRGAADWIYVSTTGNDGTGDGTSGNPYLTVAAGISHASTGDTVYIVAGTYNVGTQIALPAGISLMGAGATSVITATAALDPMILMSSASEGTNGNQTISYLKFDGDLTGYSGFSSRQRSNVVFNNCTFVDFLYTAIEVYGGASFTTAPTTYATGIVIRNTTIDNCCQRRDPGTFGAIRIGGTTGMEVHDCILTQNSRATGHNGNLVYLWGATNHGFKFYSNHCTKPDTDGVESGYADGWNFHIESGNSSGFEVYDNTFIGGVAIDLAGGIQVKGSYDYSWWIHDNDFSISTQIATPAAGTHPPCGIDYERTNEDVIVERNRFRNYPWAINVTLDENTYHKLRLHFRYNLFTNLGYSDGLYAFGGIQFVGTSAATGDLCSYIYIDNNVFDAGGARGLIHLQSPYNLDHFYIRNNIFTDAASYGWLNAWDLLGDGSTPTGTYSYFTLQNNLLYNNANSNAIYYRAGKTISNLTNTGSILGSNPLFVTGQSARLQSTSPAINAGISVGLTTDYYGHRVPQSDTVDIGAHEYGDYLIKIGGKFLRTADSKLIYIH